MIMLGTDLYILIFPFLAYFTMFFTFAKNMVGGEILCYVEFPEHKLFEFAL